jgi:hypothetical protein
VCNQQAVSESPHRYVQQLRAGLGLETLSTISHMRSICGFDEANPLNFAVCGLTGPGLTSAESGLIPSWSLIRLAAPPFVA